MNYWFELFVFLKCQCSHTLISPSSAFPLLDLVVSASCTFTYHKLFLNFFYGHISLLLDFSSVKSSVSHLCDFLTYMTAVVPEDSVWRQSFWMAENQSYGFTCQSWSSLCKEGEFAVAWNFLWVSVRSFWLTACPFWMYLWGYLQRRLALCQWAE